MSWYKLSTVEAIRLLRDKGTRRVGVHKMTERVCRMCPWYYCAHCGLLGLNNDVTRRALRAPCVYRD